MKHSLWPITLCMSGVSIKLLSSCMFVGHDVSPSSSMSPTYPFEAKKLGAGKKRLREISPGKATLQKGKFKHDRGYLHL